MYVVVAKDHTAYEKFLNDNFRYIGDERDISRIDPAKVRRIVFADGYDQHPIYFTDSFLKLQFEVAAHKVMPKPEKKKWWKVW